MTRLVAFGCSLTYGHGLHDCWDSETQYAGEKPSTVAWPSIAAKELKIDCVNISYPGASAKEILFKIQNFNFRHDDIAVILWPWPSRSCVITLEEINLEESNYNRKAFERFMPTFNNSKNKNFYSVYNETDSIVDYYTRIEYANFFLTYQNIPALHLTVDDCFVKNFKWKNANLENIYFTKIKNKFPLALDGEHPGELAHQEFGLEIAKKINSFIS